MQYNKLNGQKVINKKGGHTIGTAPPFLSLFEARNS